MDAGKYSFHGTSLDEFEQGVSYLVLGATRMVSGEIALLSWVNRTIISLVLDVLAFILFVSHQEDT